MHLKKPLQAETMKIAILLSHLLMKVWYCINHFPQILPSFTDKTWYWDRSTGIQIDSIIRRHAHTEEGSTSRSGFPSGTQLLVSFYTYVTGAETQHPQLDSSLSSPLKGPRDNHKKRYPPPQKKRGFRSTVSVTKMFQNTDLDHIKNHIPQNGYFSQL